MLPAVDVLPPEMGRILNPGPGWARTIDGALPAVNPQLLAGLVATVGSSDRPIVMSATGGRDGDATAHYPWMFSTVGQEPLWRGLIMPVRL